MSGSGDPAGLDATTLNCHELGLSFGGHKVLNGFSVTFAGAGITAVVGPNGAGKTTLFNVITGFIQPDSGECFLGDKQLTGRRPHSIARLGIGRTFQDVRFIARLSVIDNLLLASNAVSGPTGIGLRAFLSEKRIREEHSDRCAEVLETIGLTQKAGDTASTLSFGQQKLLSIGCCLMNPRKYYLLDEPFAGVHPELVVTITETLKKMSKSSEVIFIEHDFEIIEKIAERVVAIHQGHLIVDGPPDQVFDTDSVLEAFVG